MGAAEIFATVVTEGAAAAAARVGEAPLLEGPTSSAQFDKQRLPRPLKGRQIVKLFLRGVVGVSKAVLQRLHTELELVQTECQLVDACCPAILSGTCRRGQRPKVRWGWGALADRSKAMVRRELASSKLSSESDAGLLLSFSISVAKRKKCKRNRAKKNVENTRCETLFLIKVWGNR